MSEEKIITKLERGRAEFAYKCVEGLIKLNFSLGDGFLLSNEWVELFKKNISQRLKKDEKEVEEKIKKILEQKDSDENMSDNEKKLIEEYKKILKNYRSYVRKIPQMVISNGLGQTIAFISSKKKNGNAYDLIYRQLTDYLKSNHTARIKMKLNEGELIKWIISRESLEYRYVTEEVLSFFKWLRKFAEGMIEEEEEE